MCSTFSENNKKTTNTLNQPRSIAENNYAPYEKHYSDSHFWGKLKSVLSKIGFARDMLAMYFCMKDERTPLWVKGLIVGALGYFIMPWDAVPDLIPVAGWADDAGVIAAVMGVIYLHIRPDHWEQADRCLGEL